MCFRSQMLLAGTWKPVKQWYNCSAQELLLLLPHSFPCPTLGCLSLPCVLLALSCCLLQNLPQIGTPRTPQDLLQWQGQDIRRLCTHRSALLAVGSATSGATYEAWEGASKGCRFMASTAVTRQRHLALCCLVCPLDLRVSTTGRESTGKHKSSEH